MKALSVALLVALSPGALAQPAPPPGERPAATEPGAGPPEAGAAEVEALRRRTGAIRDFLRGRLDPAADPEGLFTLDLAGAALGEDPGAALARLLGEIGTRGARPAPPGGDAQEVARSELLAAMAEYLRRPAADRARLRLRHDERRRKSQEAEEELRALRARAEALELASAQLGAYLDGRLAREVDPAPFLRVNLLDESEIGADPQRRRRFLGPPAQAAAAAPRAGGPPDPEARLDAARRRMDELRRRYLSLSPAERAALEAKHREGLGEQEAAERARAEAARGAEEERARREEELRRAETEAARLAAEEQMRLLSARTELAAAERLLEELAGTAEASRERALGWIRRARELEARSVLDADLEEEVDAAYGRLVADLTGVRASLAGSLQELSSRRSRVPDPPPTPEVTIDDPELEEARAEVSRKVDRLRALEEGIRWERVTVERDAMVTMNQVRLRLFERLSPGKREALRGPGPEGIQQALREVTQIALEIRFHRHALPRMARARLASARANPLPELLGLAQLAALLLVFRWWRRRADPILRGLQARFRERRPPSPLDRAGATLVWYLRRVHVPLEWLVLFLVLGGFPVVSRVPELSYLFLVLAWALAGWLVTRLLDAVAARQGTAGEGTDPLRWRSLRLAGVTVVAAGLLLTIAERSVGRGALYGWISRAAWLAVLPVAAILVAWWRPTIFARILCREPRGPVLEWSLGRSKGLASFPAAAVGGLWLLGEGIGRFVAGQAGEFAAVQRVLAWLFRREVERRRAVQVERVPLEPLGEDALAALDPEEGRTALVESYGLGALRRVRELLAAGSGTAIAVVAERGLGKTVFLERIRTGPGMEGAVRVGCRPGGGFDALVADLWEALGLDGDPSIVKLAQALRERRPPAVLVDDAQRIVRPVIGGLVDVDRLLALTRAVGTATSWVVAIGTPGYGYLERARGSRVTFDEVVRLEPWTLEETAELLTSRTRAAGLEPTFDELVTAGPAEAVAEESRLERAERDFHGLLWDYSGGNAAVALHAWRQSLGLRPGSREVVVRLADAPRAEDLDDLAANLFFVLRAVLQLELAAEQDVAPCTGLRVADVADALRAARVRGITEPRGDRIRISLRWYRAVTLALRRRHLVAF